MFDLRLPLPGSTRLLATTQVDPLGKVRYTASVGGFAFGKPISTVPSGPGGDAIGSYLIRGTVVDTTGRPVAGAALRVDGELVFTDSRGLFEVRKPRAKEYGIEVALDDFMFPGTYEVVSSPKTVRSTDERHAPECRVVLRRVR